MPQQNRGGHTTAIARAVGPCTGPTSSLPCAAPAAVHAMAGLLVACSLLCAAPPAVHASSAGPAEVQLEAVAAAEQALTSEQAPPPAEEVVDAPTPYELQDSWGEMGIDVLSG